MQSQDFIVDNNGNFRFTKVGLINQAPLLAKAGIDASSIKTYQDYIQARQAASPFFLEYIRDEMDLMLDGKADTLEWQTIRSIAYGTTEEQDLMIKRLKTKQTIKLV